MYNDLKSYNFDLVYLINEYETSSSSSSCYVCPCVVMHRAAVFRPSLAFSGDTGAWTGVLEDVPNAQDRVRPSGKTKNEQKSNN